MKRKYYGSMIFAFSLLCMLLAYLTFCFTQKNDYFTARYWHPAEQITDIAEETAESPDSPIGFVRRFTMTVPEDAERIDGLHFYTAHSSVRIRLNEETVYEVRRDRNNIGKTIGNMVHSLRLESKDVGSKLEIEICPAYRSVLNKKVVFYAGSRYEVFKIIFNRECPVIFLSLFEVLCGIGYLILTFSSRNNRILNFKLSYLGIFAVMIGIWRVMDTQSVALVFGKYSLQLTSLSLMALSGIAAPCILFIQNKLSEKLLCVSDILIVLCSLLMACMPVLQLAGILDLREMLPAIHFMDILAVIFFLATTLIMWDVGDGRHKDHGLLFAMALCAVGGMIDLIIFLHDRSSDNLFMMSFVSVLYVGIIGSVSIYRVRHCAYIDSETGLYNKERCMTMLMDKTVLYERTILLLMDIDGMKKYNEVYGRKSGDEIIYQLTEELKRCFPKCFIGRSGGDEFLLILRNTQEKQADAMTELFSRHCTEKKIPLSVSCVKTCSEHYMDCTLKILFDHAREKMDDLKHKKRSA